MRVSQNLGYQSGGLVLRLVVFWGLDWGPLFRETTICFGLGKFGKSLSSIAMKLRKALS